MERRESDRRICALREMISGKSNRWLKPRCGMSRAPDSGMSQESEDLKARAEAFAVAIVNFCDTLPNTLAGRRIGQQLLDAATSVAANYRAVCRAYTRPLFISKLAIVDEEADESEFWLRLIRKTGLRTGAAIGSFEQEAHELACIFSASLRTARSRPRRQARKDNRPFRRSSP